MANLYSPATIIAAIKQEPPQSPPSLPPPEPIPQPISMVTIIAAIKQELLQSLTSPPPPAPFPPPFLSPPTPIPPPSLPLPTPIPSSSLLRPNIVPPPSQPLPSPVPPPLAVVKTEPEQPVQQQKQPPPQQQQQQQSQFLKSINDLASLSKALNTFNAKFEELTDHLVSINQAIDSKFNEPPPAHTNISSSITPPQQQQIETRQPESLKPKQIETETPKTDSCPRPPPSTIQRFCHGMSTKCVRKYIVTKLSDIPKLREEIPEALKLAPEPAKLVLDCVGQFFLSGEKACTNNPNIISIRKALVLLLDIFGCFRGENRIIVAVKVKVDAEKVATIWRKRLIREGGLDKASEVDARGLLLFIACFGIPRVFSDGDLGILFKLSNPKGVSDALKASPLLPCRIPDIIDTMVKNGMHFQAVEVVSIFGLEDKFSPRTILNSLLPESIKAFEKAKQEARITPLALKKATEKKRKRPKRKLDQTGSSSAVKSQEMKRSRFETEGPPLPKSHVNQSCEQPTAVLVESDGLVPNSLNANNYPAVSAAPHGSLNGMGHMAGTTGVGSSDIGVIPASSCSGEDGMIEVDKKTGQMMSSNGLPYRWQQGCVPQSTSMWFAGLFGSSPSVEGFVGVLDSTVRTSADRYRFADSLA